MNGLGKVLGVDSAEAMDLARRGVEALEKLSESVTWLQGEVERTDLLDAVAKNAWNVWNNDYTGR